MAQRDRDAADAVRQAAEALRQVAEIGPFFALALDPPDPGWVTFADFVADHDAVAAAIAEARSQAGGGCGCGRVSRRVAGSCVGLASRRRGTSRLACPWHCRTGRMVPAPRPGSVAPGPVEERSGLVVAGDPYRRVGRHTRRRSGCGRGCPPGECDGFRPRAADPDGRHGRIGVRPRAVGKCLVCIRGRRGDDCERATRPRRRSSGDRASPRRGRRPADAGPLSVGAVPPRHLLPVLPAAARRSLRRLRPAPDAVGTAGTSLTTPSLAASLVDTLDG